MARVPVPLVRSEADYKAILDIPVLDIPDSFNMWTYDREQEAREISRGGHTEIAIEVNAGKIREFCARRRLTANFQTIKDFVVEEFQGQEKAKDKSGTSGAARPNSPDNKPD